MIKVTETTDSFELQYNERKIISHSDKSPFIFVGVGEHNIDMYRGNFKIKDYVIERIPLKINLVEKNKISFSHCNKNIVDVIYAEESDKLVLNFDWKDSSFNRVWLRLDATADEKVYGCGEQMSYFNLRGRNFPLWTSEPGVGRDKNTYVTFLAETKDKAGGDYYNTNYPEPTFVSTKKYYCHLESTAYMDFNFKNDNFHELECWEQFKQIYFQTAETYIGLVEKMTANFGRKPELPEWIYNGIVLGIQGGTQNTLEKLQKAIDNNVKVSGVWCQDWQGKRITSFGKRLNWNWRWNENEYPNLDKEIHKLKERNIKFLGYINPYVVEGFDLYKTAKEKGYLATKKDGSDYLVDFGEFYCGCVDFTNDEACEWYKTVIKENMINFGLDGWMADFGEYLPTDCYLSNGVSAEIMHNAWPTLWSKINDEAISESNKTNEILYFMRAGFSGVQKYSGIIWAGDQCVDFSLHDGLASVIPAALSSGICGNPYSHSDIGGYTTLHGLKRTKELLLRWCEMNTFTPFMRTHEGNRPDDNIQFDNDLETLQFFAKMTNIYVHLSPYMKKIVKEASQTGIPVQRPLFMHYEEDKNTYDIQYEYLLGRDILVAPVYKEDVREWEVYLPCDEWVHMFTGEEFTEGTHTISAPLGTPPVFYRKNCEYAQLFNQVKDM